MPYTVEYFNNFKKDTLLEIARDNHIPKYTTYKNNKQNLAEYICNYLNSKSITINEDNYNLRKTKAKIKAVVSDSKSEKSEENSIIDKQVFMPPQRVKSKSEVKETIQKEDSEDDLPEEENLDDNPKELTKNAVEEDVIPEKVYDVIKDYSITKVLSDKVIEHIYHISDTHLQPYINKSDYYHFDDVFGKLAYIINTDTKSKILIITGDIFDHKLKNPATCQRKLQIYMENIKCEKVIILGNHDKDLNNIDSYDNIEPTISAYDNIHYLQDSGIYQYGNIDFYVSSLLDNKIYPVIEKKNKYNICLYHGMVRGTLKDKLDNFHNRTLDFKDDEKIKSIKDFGDYDYALLGDIHKRQYLDKEHTAWYPGSLIQKNFGENINGHGYVLLDLLNNTHSFNDIKSDYGYVNIILNDDNYYLYNENKEDLCPNMKLKFKININVKNTVDFIKKIIKDLNVSPINIKEETYIEKKILLTNNLINNKENSNILNENEELRKYILENKERLELCIKGEITDNIIKEIIKLHNENHIDYETNNNENKFELDFIEFKNLLKFGTGDINRINFRDGMYIINGQNTIGKSSIIKLIQFGLFGVKSDIDALYKVINKNTRKNINDNYIHIGFTINNDKYIIERNKIKHNKRIKNNKTINESEYGNILLKKNGVLVSINKNDFDKYILSLINTNENFKNISLINDNEKNDFVKTSDIQRLTKFEKLLGLNKYIEFEKNIKNKLTQIRKDYNLLEGQIQEKKKHIKVIDINMINQLKVEINKLLEEYKMLNTNNMINSKHKKEIENEIILLNKKIIPLEDTKEVNIDNKKENLLKLCILEEELKLLNNEIILLRNIDNIEENKLLLNQKDYNKYSIIYNDLKSELSKIDINDIIKLYDKQELIYINVNNLNLKEIILSYKENIDKIKIIENKIIEYEYIINNYIMTSNIINDKEYNFYQEKLEVINNIYNDEILENLNFKTKILDLNELDISHNIEINSINRDLLNIEKELEILNININKIKHLEKIDKNTLINSDNENIYKELLNKINSVYNKNIESKINFKTVVKNIENIKIVNMNDEYKELEHNESILKDIILEKQKIGNIESILNIVNIKNENDYINYKSYIKNIENILDNNLRNTIYNKNKRVDINNIETNKKLFREKDAYKNELIIINNDLLKYDLIKKEECIISNNEEYEVLKSKLNILNKELEEINKNKLINNLNINYDISSFNEIIKEEYIKSEFVINNIDNLYHYLNNKNVNIEKENEILNNINNYNTEILKYENNLKYNIKNNLEIKKSILNDNIKDIENKIIEYQENYNIIKNEIIIYEKNKIIENNIKLLNNLIIKEEDINCKININKENIYNIIEYKKIIEEELEHYYKYIKYKNNQIKLKEFENLKEKNIIKKENIKEQLYNIYYYKNKLIKDIDNYIKNNEYNTNKELLNNLLNNLEKLRLLNNVNLKNINIIYTNYLTLKTEINIYNNNIEYNNKIKELKDKESIYEKKEIEKNNIKKILDNIEKYEIYLKQKNMNNINSKELNIKEKKLECYNNKINIIKENELLTEIKLKEKDLNIYENLLLENNNLNDNLNLQIIEFNNIKEDKIIHELYLKIINTNEYPSILLNLYIKKIEEEINQHIVYFMSDKIILRIEDKKLLCYKINKDGGEIGLNESSNYEQIVICSLLKLIFKNNNIHSTSDIIMIDEVLDDINKLNYDKIEILVTFLEKYYKKILIITHNNEIKNLLEKLNIKKNIINIKVKNDRSYIL